MNSVDAHTVDILPGPFGSQARDHGLTTQQIFLTRQDLGRRILTANLQAGATVGVTPTWGANARGRESSPFSAELREWNQNAARVAQSVFGDRSVFGSLAPLLDTSGKDDLTWDKLGKHKVEWARRRHSPQLRTLIDAGITQFLLEACRYPEEAVGLVRELTALGARHVICSFETPDGNVPREQVLTFAHVQEALADEGRGKIEVGVGVNCSSIDACTAAIEREAPGTFSALYPNASTFPDDATRDRYLTLAQNLRRDPEQEVEYRRLREHLQCGQEALTRLGLLARDRRTRIIGVCCGGTTNDVERLSQL